MSGWSCAGELRGGCGGPGLERTSIGEDQHQGRVGGARGGAAPGCRVSRLSRQRSLAPAPVSKKFSAPPSCPSREACSSFFMPLTTSRCAGDGFWWKREERGGEGPMSVGCSTVASAVGGAETPVQEGEERMRHDPHHAWCTAACIACHASGFGSISRPQCASVVLVSSVAPWLWAKSVPPA